MLLLPDSSGLLFNHTFGKTLKEKFYTLFFCKVFRYGCSEAIPIFFNRFKSDLILV